MFLVLVISPSIARADWNEERRYFEGGVADFGKAYGNAPKATLLETDLDGKPVNPDEVARRPGSYLVGVTCMRFVAQLADQAGDDFYRAAFKNVTTITCQYAHYYKGKRDKDIVMPSGNLPGGNPNGENEPESDGKVIFLPEKGTSITSIKIIMNWGLGAGGHWQPVVGASLHARFPQHAKR
ncbi:MAG TPA: hypothetical protein VH165_34900 [Kofleriaceae bacterium]|jgi:hypothetical protein|nr:hypothetical protein [Kofleriaceae bacterium]